MTGFDCDSFDSLLVKFGPMFDGHTPFDESGMIVEFEYVTGRKREVQSADCLGLALIWTRTRGPLNVLQLVFGLTLTNLSVYLRFGIRLIVETFQDDPLASVSIPSAKKTETFKAAFAVRHPLLNDCWATINGLKLNLQQSGNTDIQEWYYNGWTHDHYVTSVFCVCPDGTIPISFFNVPGSVHDSSEKYTTNWRMSICQRGQSAALTRHSATYRGIIYINCARIFWGLLHPHVGREF